VRSNAGQVLNTIFNILGRLFGLFLLFLGTILLIGYAMSLLGISIVDSEHNLASWKAVIFESGIHYNLAVLAFIVVVGIPVFMLLYVGIKLLFRIRYSNRWLSLTLGILWLMGIVTGFYVAMATVKQFSQSSRLKESYTLKGTGDTIVVKLNPVGMTVRSWPVDHKDDVESDLSFHHGGYRFAESGKELSIIGFAKLDVVESNSDSVELVISYSSKGATRKEANESARCIRYAYVQKDNELVFDQVFRVVEGMKFRAQEVDMKLKLPVGKVIYFDKSVKYLLSDVDNVTNTWDGDMVARRWEMTTKGLKCIDCENLRDVDEYIRRAHRLPAPPSPPYPPDGDHSDEDIRINDEGVHIHSKDANVEINKDGIHIDKKRNKNDGEE